MKNNALNKKKSVGRTQQTARWSGFTQDERNGIKKIENSFNIEKNFNLEGKLENVLLNYQAEKNELKKLTNKQKLKRNIDIITKCKNLQSQLELIDEDEYWRVQKNINHQDAKSQPRTVKYSKNLITPINYFDLVQDLLHHYLPLIIEVNELAINQLEQNTNYSHVIKGQLGRTTNYANQYLIFSLAQIYTLATNQDISYTRTDYTPHTPYSGSTVEFCWQIIQLLLPKENITNQGIGDRLKELRSLQKKSSID